MTDELEISANEIINIHELAKTVIQNAAAKNITIAAAESCTGGLICAALTSIVGSSKVLLGGFVTYSNDFKERYLNVPHKTLLDNGAVSKETALAMLKGIRNASHASLNIAVTGIAGPDGGSEAKPVGLVYIAINDINGKNYVHEFRFSGSRHRIRIDTVKNALLLLKDQLDSQINR
ncbi:competence damage-inducible protein A [Candidatus Magnetoovum chiemensis]|nr:competence damage-inducible protein A [Candidatus Magnetoovum chiemensis]